MIYGNAPGMTVTARCRKPPGPPPPYAGAPCPYRIDRKMMMQTLTVGLGERSYPIHIGSGLLGRAELLRPCLPRKRAAIVTNTTVAALYLAALQQTLQSIDIDSVPIVLPDGEEYKNSATLNLIYDALLNHRCERSTPLIALGGGVIGDMTGYAAAIYLRGVAFYQVLTTLLA